jgi:predicted extracellular nuclease
VENYFSTTGEEYVASGQGTCTYYDDREGNHIGDNRCHDAEGNPGPRGAATAESFDRQQDKIVTGINRLGASIVSLEEIENSVKFNKDRDDALAGLVEALNDEAGSDVWAYVPSPPAADLPPVAQQDVIRTGFIYKPADVTPVGVSHVLADQSGEGQPFSIAREPLAQAFKKAGVPDSYSFLVVANHFKSKGADADSLFDGCVNGGDQEATDPAYDQGAFNCTRVHEARAVVTFAEDTAAEVGTDKIFLLGDLNAYTHEDPMQVLYDAGYTDLSSTFDPSEQSYNYNDLAGSLDHVLANPAALSMVTGADIWQINAQESVAYAYSRYNYNVTQLFDGDEPFAASDHNPEVVGLALPSPVPGWDASTVYHAGDQVTYDGSTWQALWWTQNQTPGDPYGPWQEMTTAPDGTAIWTASRVFHADDVVLYQGSRYVAQWYTRNQAPGQPYGPWKPVG